MGEKLSLEDKDKQVAKLWIIGKNGILTPLNNMRK